jgi:ATP-dependent RNA helicase DOB1
MRVVRVALAVIRKMSSVRVYLPSDLTEATGRRKVSSTIDEVKRRFKGELPLLDPIKDMKVAGPEVKDLIARRASLEKSLESSPLHKAADRDVRLAQYSEKAEVLEKAKLLRKEAKAAQSLVMRDELRRMKRVLRKTGHTNAENVIQLKGRAACEINTADELVVTELMFSGLFNDLSVEQIGGLLSCVVHEERRKDDVAPKFKEELMAPFRKLQETARNIARVSVEAKMELDPEEYVNSFNPDLMEVVYEWCAGAKFVDVIKLTDSFEGSVIRVIRRLEVLLRQLASAAFVIGNMELKDKFELCASKMRRDIVFAASLYL